MVKAVHPKKRTVHKKKTAPDKKAVTSYRKSTAAGTSRTGSRHPATHRVPTASARRAPVQKKKNHGLLRGLFSSDRKSGEMDYSFLLLVGVLTIFGLIMLLSASTPTADVKFGESYHFFIRQFAFVVAGTLMMFVIARIDYRKFKPFSKLFLLVCILLLTLVFFPKIGVEHNGSHRWINLGFMEIQPSEFTKLAVSMFFAAIVEDRLYNLNRLKDIFRMGFWIIIIAGLMMFETHLSGTIVICGIALCIMLVAGLKLRYVLTCGALASAVAWIYLQYDEVRMARVTSFLNPFADKQDKGFQTIQSLYAIGSGGVFGKGLGQSVQKFSYLPEPYNDFIFSIVCEELGLVGAIFIIGLFAALLLRGIKIAADAPDTFGSIMVIGIMSQVAIQTILNIAVVTSSMPNTGVPLPFFSYGGTALMILLMEMGIVLSVSRYSKKNN